MRRVSDDIEIALQHSVFEDIWTLLSTQNSQRSFGLAFLLTALPSALPLPAPGYSTPFGILIIILCFQMLSGKKQPWIPQWAKRKEIPAKFRMNMKTFLVKIFSYSELLIRPRGYFLFNRLGLVYPIVIIIGLATIMIIPIPGTNTLPAFIIFCLGLSFSEHDGLAVTFFSILGTLIGLIYIVAFYFLFNLGFENLKQVFEWLLRNI